MLNGNVLIAKNDSVIFRRSYGFADPDKTRLLTADHQFAMGSIQKELTAVAIMHLYEDGALQLDDSLSQYFPDFPRWADSVTLRHLLQYSSGLPVIEWDQYFLSGKVPNQQHLVDGLQFLPGLAFSPGTDYLYSNYNPFLLERIVELVSGLEFCIFTQEELFYPHDLNGFQFKHRYPFSDTSLIALPFDDDFNTEDIAYEISTVCATSTGLYQWFRKLDNFSLLSESSMSTLSEVAISGHNIQAPLGRCDWEDGDISLHLHHGSHGNYESLVQGYKQEGLIIVLQTNQKHGNVHDIAEELRRLVKKERA